MLLYGSQILPKLRWIKQIVVKAHTFLLLLHQYFVFTCVPSQSVPLYPSLHNQSLGSTDNREFMHVVIIELCCVFNESSVYFTRGIITSFRNDLLTSYLLVLEKRSLGTCRYTIQLFQAFISGQGNSARCNVLQKLFAAAQKKQVLAFFQSLN